MMIQNKKTVDPPSDLKFRDELAKLGVGPLKVKGAKLSAHFICPTCGTQFWTTKQLGIVNCPNGNCGTRWIPATMDGWYEKGIYEEIVTP